MMKCASAILRICLFKVTMVITCLLTLPDTKAQVIDSAFLLKQWKARWITVPETNATGYGVYYFRKSFEITSIPKTYPVHVSADNRYKLFVNEKLVSVGPARGDLQHWNFETIDLEPFLRIGHNLVTA